MTVAVARPSADTAAGMIVDQLGRLAIVGDSVSIENVRFEVVRTERHHIDLVRATREAASEVGSGRSL